ncbi:hypothetical protein LTR10_018618 [Elasticomyces elasticus]|uniref:Uncharacterized protein n=1 Tax=Exophiala sideris TaxID=1016849 RepID=A0ABR0J1Y1_9EURO|nr:hypothetical protein LTR10_018618 [Elasticomyces elasticus]KAK5023257.1 hypothetical protein LTS07_009480 [Exophiala sideris]KAK5028629.1 hypothetical protein LTR13_009081 [Exophiala sideris]KAK5053007.1 hypothetical protein LTR69_009577 [Exophiala sideris]KAK5178747.1 hypothetical protein LTR44_008862 [Eurotiomycetes sp. CCFEE 6388]
MAQNPPPSPLTQSTYLPVTTTREPRPTYSLSVDATPFISGSHEHTLQGARSRLNPQASQFVPGASSLEPPQHRQSLLNIHATEFMPGMQYHFCKAGTSTMSAMAPVFVPKAYTAARLHLQRMQLMTILSVDTAKRLVRSMPGAAVQTPNPLAAPFVPGAREWSPYTYPDPKLECRYQSRLNRVQCVNDREATPEYEPSASIKSTKSWNKETKQYEGSYQEDRGLVEDWLHHIDFFGRAVYTKSATKPATTIAILKSSVKWLSMGSDFKSRNHFLVTSASRYLDPVVYYGKPEVLTKFHGTSLENECVGRCDKFYSRNGRWRQDYYDPEEDEPYLDSLNPEHYEDGHIIINGCTPGFKTREQVLAAGTEEQLAIDSARRAALQSRKALGLVKSKLASCSTSEESAVVQVRSYSTEQTTNADETIPAIQSGPEQNSASDTTPTQSPTLTPSTAISTPVSSQEFNRRCEAIMPSLVDWSEDEDAVEDAQAQQEDDTSAPAPVQGCLTHSEAMNQQLEEIGPISNNTSWSDDIDVEDRNEHVENSSPQPTSTPSAPLETIVEETSEELDPITSEGNMVADANDVTSPSEPSTSEVGHSPRPSISSSDGTPPTSVDESNEEQVDSVVQRDDETDSVYHVNDQPGGQVDVASSEAAERTDDEIFGMSLEEEYENIHGVPMPVETSEDVNHMSLVSTQSVAAVMGVPTRVYSQHHLRALPLTVCSGRFPRLLVGATVNGRLIPLLTTLRFGTVSNSLLYVVRTASRVDTPYMSFTPRVAYNEVVLYHHNLLQQRVVEIVDDEEEIIGTVIHPNITIRGTDNDNITPAVIVDDITPEANVEEAAPLEAASSTEPTASASGVSEPQTPRQQPTRRQVRFVEPPQACSPVSTASRYSSLAELVTGYDQWPDFSAIHHESPLSSVSSRSSNHDDETLEPIPTLPTFGSVRAGRRRAGWNFIRKFSANNNTVHLKVVGEGPSQTTEVEKKGWLKKGISKVKGFFSKKKN